MLNDATFKHSLHNFSETILHWNTKLIEDDVQFVYTLPSKLTINADCEHQ